MHDIHVICLFMWKAYSVTSTVTLCLCLAIIIKEGTLYTYSSGYRFVEVFNWPADLPLRFIIVCVVEPMTLEGEKQKNEPLTPSSAVNFKSDRSNRVQLKKQDFSN